VIDIPLSCHGKSNEFLDSNRIVLPGNVKKNNSTFPVSGKIL